VRTAPEPIERKAKAERPCATPSHCSQEMLSQPLGEVVLRPKELTHEAFLQLTNRVQTIDVAWGQAESQQFALIARDQVQLEAVEPSY
jgi:hypothetical protein